MRKISLLIFGYLALLSTSCTPETLQPDLDRQGYGFYPLETGLYRIYKVNATNYTNTNEVVKDSFLVKELLIDSFPNAHGGISYILNIYSKSFQDNIWQLDSVWSVGRTVNGLLVTENNQSILKLSFPVAKGKIWNGNAYNTSPERMYEVTALDEEVLTILGDTIFQQALEVIQLDIPGPIVAKQFKREVYGRGVGVLFKENIYIDYDSTQNSIDFGFEYRQKLIEFGKE